MAALDGTRHSNVIERTGLSRAIAVVRTVKDAAGKSKGTKTRDKAAALKFLKKMIKRHCRPHVLVTDRLRSYCPAMKEIGNAGHQETGHWLYNRAENSHQQFRRWERAMLRLRDMHKLQKFSSVHASIRNHFNQEHHLINRQDYKVQRSGAFAAW